jgi:hypothetical protein
MTLRITWADCVKAGACIDALPIFQRAVADQGHGEFNTLILPQGWQETHVRKCLSYPGGAWWLHFLESKDLVPVVESDAKVFPHELAAQRRAIRIREARRALRP